MPIDLSRPISVVMAEFESRIAAVETGTGTPTPAPAPVITTPAAINSDGTPQVGEQLTGIDPTGTNGTVTLRRWLQGTTVLTNVATYTPVAVGDYRFEADFTGTDGTVLTSGSTVTVAAATSTPTPTPGPTPSDTFIAVVPLLG